MILSDAQKRQQNSKEKLNKLEVESLLTKRDGLLAQGVLYRVMETESQRNIRDAEGEVGTFLLG